MGLILGRGYPQFCQSLVPSVSRLFKVRPMQVGIAGTAIEMHVLLFQSIKRPFQIPVVHFDQNRTIKYQFHRWF